MEPAVTANSRGGAVKRSVLQDWVHDLTFMQQGVLLAAVRGPDGIRKDHVAKLLLRWLRRSMLVCAFDGTVVMNPWDPRGGSFTGPSLAAPSGPVSQSVKDLPVTGEHETWMQGMDRVLTDYFRTVDELPHHFQLHFMHAAEILGYKHPDPTIRAWWHKTYLRLVNDLHLLPEPEERMNWRLGDQEPQWRAAEEVTANGPQQTTWNARQSTSRV